MNKNDSLDNAFAQNKEREQKMLKGGNERFKNREKQMEQKAGLSSTQAGTDQREEVLGKVIAAFERFFEEEFARKSGRRPNWYQHLVKDIQVEDDEGRLVKKKAPVMDLERMATVAVAVMQDAVRRDWSLNSTCVNLGRQFHTEMFAQLLDATSRGRAIRDEIDKWTKQKEMMPQNRILRAMNHAKKMGFSFDEQPKEDYMVVGAFLYSGAIYSDLFIKEDFIDWDDEDANEVRKISLTPLAQEQLESQAEFLSWLTPKFGPMASPPQACKNGNLQGPYNDPALAAQTPIVKNSHAEQKDDIRQAMEDGSLDRALYALNTLQEVPYEINSYVLDAIKWVIKTKGIAKGVASFPDLAKTAQAKHDDDNLEGLDDREIADYWKDRNEVVIDNRTVVSNMLNLKSHVQEAEELEKLGAFWLPHQWDSRSRVYHTPHFGHHTQDYLRGLFMFHNKTKVKGNEAFLHLQLANTYGKDANYTDPETGEVGATIDKMSFDGRMRWVADNLKMIRKAGEDYKASKEVLDFWSAAEDSLQFLGACREWYLFEQDEDNYQSGLPIGLDATQSGLQHYMAASRNGTVGKLVNLLPSTSDQKPEDVYLEALAETHKLLERDRDDYQSQLLGINDPEEKRKIERYLTACEELLDMWGKDKIGVTRSVAKRPCMTWGYSSKRYGMKKQLKKDWMNKISKAVRQGNYDRVHPYSEKGWVACDQLAKVIEEAIRNVAYPAAQGMDFFKDCSRVLSKHNLHMRFVTPMGFPMHQYYRLEATKETEEVLDGQEDKQPGQRKKRKKKKRQRLWLMDRETGAPEKDGRGNLIVYSDDVDARKSANAISPNIIHSMDATHLMLTVELLAKNNITDIMTVHDSFSTTIGNAEAMAEALKVTFKQLYEDYNLYEDILMQSKERLFDHLVAEMEADWLTLHPEAEEVPIEDSTDIGQIAMTYLKTQCDWPEVPDIESGDLDFDGILESQYIFS